MGRGWGAEGARGVTIRPRPLTFWGASGDISERVRGALFTTPRGESGPLPDNLSRPKYLYDQ